LRQSGHQSGTHGCSLTGACYNMAAWHRHGSCVKLMCSELQAFLHHLTSQLSLPAASARSGQTFPHAAHACRTRAAAMGWLSVPQPCRKHSVHGAAQRAMCNARRHAQHASFEVTESTRQKSCCAMAWRPVSQHDFCRVLSVTSKAIACPDPTCVPSTLSHQATHMATHMATTWQPTPTCQILSARGCWWQPPHSPPPAAPQTGPSAPPLRRGRQPGEEAADQEAWWLGMGSHDWVLAGRPWQLQLKPQGCSCPTADAQPHRHAQATMHASSTPRAQPLRT